MQPRQILVVADDRTSDRICRTLELRGFGVMTTACCHDAIQELIDSQCNLIIVELNSPEADYFIKEVRNTVSLNGTPLLAIGQWGTGQPTLALSAGADAYEATPIDDARLADAVERILNKRAAVVGVNE